MRPHPHPRRGGGGGPFHVTLADGTRLTADAVVDGRGAAPAPHLDLGWQKFLGQEVRLARPHGLRRPIIMDARVPQLDGYRFLYVLPLDAETLLVEDTCYADGPELPLEAVRARIAGYLAAQGFVADYVVREETGVLPIALGGEHPRPSGGRAAAGGAHRPRGRAVPPTGYSLPDAVALAGGEHPARSPARRWRKRSAATPFPPEGGAASSACSTACCSAPPRRAALRRPATFLRLAGG